MKRRFTCTEGGAHKFWEVEQIDSGFQVVYGKIGTAGTTAQKQFDSPEQAAKEADKLILAKVKKGYVEEETSAAAITTTALPSPLKRKAVTSSKKASTSTTTSPSPPLESIPNAEDAIASESINPCTDSVAATTEMYPAESAEAFFGYTPVDMSPYPLYSMVPYSRCVTDGKLRESSFSRFLNGFELFKELHADCSGHLRVEETALAFAAGALEETLCRAVFAHAQPNTPYTVSITAGEHHYQTQYLLLEEKVCGHFRYLEYETIALSGLESIPDAHLRIPCTIHGKPVDALLSSFLLWERDITSIELPQTLRILQSRAFTSCELSQITIPASAVSIGIALFSDNRTIQSIRFEGEVAQVPPDCFSGCTQLKELHIQGMRKIGAHAFRNVGLTSIELTGVEELDAYCFSDSDLVKVVLPDCLVSVGDFAFLGCSDLTSMSIGKGLCRWGHGSFVTAHAATRFTVSPENPILSADAEGLFDRSKKELLVAHCTDGRYQPAEQVESIGEWAFLGSGLTSLSLGKQIKSIAATAFCEAYASSPRFRLTSLALHSDNSYFKLLDDLLYTADGKILIVALDTHETYTLPSGVEELFPGAFYAHQRLKEIHLPNSVRVIGELTFFECKALRLVTMSPAIEHIGEMAFYFTQSLPHLDFYQTKFIGANAFRHHVFTEVTLGDGIEFVGDHAFSQGKRLKKVQIGKGNTHLGERCFSSCDLLEKLTVGEGNKTFQRECFASNDRLKSVAIGEGTTSIGKQAFYHCESLETLSLPESLRVVEYEAFKNCEGLTDLTFPQQLEQIGGHAFASTGLEKAILGDALTTIGDSAFAGAKLQQLHLGAAVRFIGSEAFACPSLSTLTLDAQNQQYSLADGLLSNAAKTHALRYLGTSPAPQLPATLQKIGAGAFENNKYIQTLTLPEGVTEIGDNAFECSSIHTIRFPRTLASIGRWAFHRCLQLKELALPGIEMINEYAFRQCVALKTVTMAAGVHRLGNYAFEGCAALQTVTLSPTLQRIGQAAFKDCRKLKELALPDSITMINAQAFSQCGGLVKLTIGKGLAVIPTGAFEGARKLAELVLPPNITQVGDGAFKNAKALKSLVIQGSCAIGNSSFNSCVSLTALTLTGVSSIGNSAFKQCSGLETLQIQGDQTLLSPSAFMSCSGLKTLSLMGVNSIGASCFEDSVALETVMIGDGIDSIGKKAFARSGLLCITLANTLTQIQDNAFSDCQRLAEIKLPSPIKKLGGSLFHGFLPSQTIYVPAGLLEQKGVSPLWNAGSAAQVVQS